MPQKIQSLLDCMFFFLFLIFLNFFRFIVRGDGSGYELMNTETFESYEKSVEMDSKQLQESSEPMESYRMFFIIFFEIFLIFCVSQLLIWMFKFHESDIRKY